MNAQPKLPTQNLTHIPLFVLSSKPTHITAMAGLTSSTFHHPFKSQQFSKLFQSQQTQTFSLRLPFNTTNCPSISTAISARYGGGGGGARSGGGGRGNRDSRTPTKSNEDEALDLSKIKSDKVRLIDQQQNMVGVMSKSQAIQMAEEAELDLVILSPEADPPVLKIMDYNKYRYEQQKKKRDQQKKSIASRVDLKELKMGYNIDVHDYSVRLRAAKRFLTDGDKVKIIVNLKGRENDFRNNAVELLRRFQADVGELAVEETKNFRDRNMFIILVPNKIVVQKIQEPPKEKKTITDNSASVEKNATTGVSASA